MKLVEILRKPNLIINRFNLYNKSFDHFYEMEAHQHGRCEIMLVEDGEYILNIFDPNGNKIKESTVKKGQFAFINSDIIHNVIVNQFAKIINFEFLLEENTENNCTISFQKMLASAPSFCKFASELKDLIVLNDGFHVCDDMTRLHTITLENSSDIELLYIKQIQVISLLLGIARCKKYDKFNTGSGHTNKAIRLIYSNLDKNLSIDIIAKTIGINAYYLQRLFKENTGMTIITYINKIRIEKAKKLLANTKQKIIDIGVAVGFNTRQNFTFAFKKMVGYSPIAYRQRLKKKEYAFQL